MERVVQGGTVLVKDDTSNLPDVTLAAHVPEVTALLWSLDSRTLALASMDGTIQLWHVATGEQRAKLRGHSHRVTALAWSTDGRLLVSLDGAGTIKLWVVGPVTK